MTEEQIKEILDKVQDWFYKNLASRHIENTKKLKNIKEFRVNPFLLPYLTKFSQGNITAENLARTLVYPRMLGTSVNTSFGNAMQSFTNEVLGAFGSLVPGIDVEYISSKDGRKKYCQMKAGSNTINKDDVATIHGHFNDAKNLAITNRVNVDITDLVVGIAYGTQNELSNHYKQLEAKHHYPILIGQDFWFDLTGDEEFYEKLINKVTDSLEKYQIDFSEEIEEVISELAKSEELKNIVEYFNVV